MITSTMTVRDIALQLPQSTRLFEKFKIDYCCGGNRSLDDACTSAGIEIDQLIEMLETANSAQNVGRDFKNLSLPQLIGHILETHHVFTREEMVRIQSLIGKVVSAHGENHPELQTVATLFQQLSADLTPHMFKEEQVLFPYMLALADAASENRTAPFPPFGTVNNPVRMMKMEHDTAGEILRELRGVTSDYLTPPDACVTYKTLYTALEAFESDLHQHIHLENNLLFPRAIELETKLRG